MPAPLAGVALAAGAGTRLHPLTLLRPKPLCPVGDRPLLEWALDALVPATPEVAVNVHHDREQVEELLSSSRHPVHVSVEHDRPLGTAGAIGHLRDWLGGRGALVVNSDTWHDADLRRFVRGWDGERVRVLTTTRGPFGPGSSVVASIVPWWAAQRLDAEPAGLWEALWGAEVEAGRLETVHHAGTAIDCGTPADYLRANLAWSGGAPVVGEGATVEGTLVRSVVWPGSHVGPTEVLVDAIRAGSRTVLVR